MQDQNRKHTLIKEAFLSASGVFFYILALVWFINNMQNWAGSKPDHWLAPVLALMLFIISACVTASLVLLKPIFLFSEGEKRNAIQLFAYTVGFLATLFFIVLFVVITA